MTHSLRQLVNWLRKPRASALPLLLAVLCCLATRAGLASQPFVSPAKERALRSMIPDEAIANEPRLILYTEREMPRLYQLFAMDSPVTSFHFASHNISADPGEASKGHGNGGNGACDFPWKHEGGTDRCRDVDSFKWLLLPEGKPVVWYQKPLTRISAYGAGYVRRSPEGTGYAWIYPVGTRIGEVLTWKVGQYDYPFEMRIRERLADKWAVDVLRPFATSESFLATLRAMPEFAGRDALIRHLESEAPLPVRSLADRNHTQRMAFNVQAQVDELPPLPADITAELLSRRPWESALGQTWRQQCFAPSGAITPVNYDGTFVGTDQTSCKRCHESTLKHVSEFESRDWYGYMTGSDGINSLSPVDVRCAIRDASHGPVRMLNIPGIFEPYDRSRHSGYQELPE